MITSRRVAVIGKTVTNSLGVMNEEIRDTWASRDLPILRAALRRLDAGEDYPELEEMRQELGFTGDELLAGIRALESAEPPYIDVDLGMGWQENRASGSVAGVSERARRELGAWPSAESLVDALAVAFAQAAEAEKEPEKKGRLRATARPSAARRETSRSL